MMTNFSTNWVREHKKDTPERIKESIRTKRPLKPRIDSTINKIQLQDQKLGTILEKLKGREKSLFNQVVIHVQRHELSQGKMLSNELAQTKKTIKTVSQLKMALEQIHFRLESTSDLGDIISAVGPAISAVTKVKPGMSNVVPEIDTELGQISGVFNDIVMGAGKLGNASFSFDTGGEDTEKILAEAGAIAEQRVSENFPDIPVGNYGGASRSSVTERSP